MSWLAKHRSQIFVAVAAGIVLEFILEILGVVKKFTIISTFLSFIIGLLQVTIKFPVWGLIIIILISLSAIPFLYLIRTKVFHNYNRDEIFGIIWKWENFQTHTGEEPRKLTPLCPKCSFELEGAFVKGLLGFVCPSCSFSKDIIIIDVDGEIIHEMGKVYKYVDKEIERRIDTDDFRYAKKRIKILTKKSQKNTAEAKSPPTASGQ